MRLIPCLSVFSTACLACLSLSLHVSAEDWSQHLGPTQDAVSAETDLLDAWPEAGPPELWRHDVGLGFAGPAIVDGQVFLNDREGDAADILRVFDLNTGEELWRYRYDAPGRVTYPGSRTTPCVTDTHIYITGGFGHVHAINRETHQPDWSFNVYDRYPNDRTQYGYGISPVLVDGLLLISPTRDGDSILTAVDPATGEEVWVSSETITNFHTFHTPVVRTIAGTRGISCRDRTHLYHLDIKTGKTIWSHQAYENKGGPHVTIAPATVIGKQNQYVFVTNGYEDGSVLFEVKPTAEGFEFEEIYSMPEGSQVHPPIYHDKHLYVNINENANLRGRDLQGGLACIDANTGEIKWKTGNAPNLNRGALAMADGKLYAFDGDAGELMLINLNPEKFEPIARFVALTPQGRSNNAWSPIVISDGRLVIRDHQQVVCYDLRDKKAER